MKYQTKYIKSILLTVVFIAGILFLNTSHAYLLSSAAIGAAIKSQFNTGKIQIDKIVLEQPHIIPPESVKKFFAKYEGREISVKDLKDIQGRLSKYYYAKGYINSGVVVPNQRITNGVIKLRAIHGRLTRVKTQGNHRVSNAYIKNAVAKGVTVPLDSKKLQSALEVLQRHPLIDTVRANISPGSKLGQSILDLQIKEASPYFLSTDVSNYQSPSIGQYRLGLNFGHRNIMGFRDTLTLNLGFSEGLVDGKADYAFPLSVNDAVFNTYINYSKFSIIDEKFSAAEIKSNSTVYGFSVTAPLYRTANTAISAGAGLDVKRMNLFIFGSDANFDAEGLNSSPFVIHLNAIYQKASFVAGFYMGLRRSSSINFASSTQSEPFTVGVGQLAVGFKPMPRLEWSLKLNGQLTRDNLVAVEKFAIGGAKTVRSYRENILVRDNGIVASTQLRISVYQSKVFIVPYLDYGKSWNVEQGVFGKTGDQIYSVGTGVQWKMTKQLYSELFWGKAISGVQNQPIVTQDYSIHFLIRYTLF